jgi:hypothetical protein
MEKDFTFEQLKTPLGDEPIEKVIYDGVVIGYIIPVELTGKKLKRDRYYFRFVKDNKVCIFSFPDKEKLRSFIQKYFDKEQKRWRKETPERQNKEVENFFISFQNFEERVKLTKKYPYEYFEVENPAEILEEELKITIPEEIKREINGFRIDQIDLLNRSLNSYIAVLTRDIPIIPEAKVNADDLNKHSYQALEKLVQIYLLWKGIEKMKSEDKLTSELEIVKSTKFGIKLNTDRVILYIPPFKSDSYEFRDTLWVLNSENDEEKVELFKHFLDRSLRVVLFERTKEELKRKGELPKLLFSTSEIAFVNLGQFLFEELRKINPELAEDIEFKYGKFVPFKVELKGLYGVESEDEWRKIELRMIYNKDKDEEINKLTIIKSPLTMQIIPYPIAKENLITSAEQAIKVLQEILERLECDIYFVNRNVVDTVYKDGYSLKKSFGEAIMNAMEIPLNVMSNLYLSASDMLYYTPTKIVELDRRKREKEKVENIQKRKRKFKL